MTGSLRFQIGISKPAGRGGRRYLPYVFTEQGVAMLSSVLNRERAVQGNIAIMRAFVQMRELAARKLSKLSHLKTAPSRGAVPHKTTNTAKVPGPRLAGHSRTATAGPKSMLPRFCCHPPLTKFPVGIPGACRYSSSKA